MLWMRTAHPSTHHKPESIRRCFLDARGASEGLLRRRFRLPAPPHHPHHQPRRNARPTAAGAAAAAYAISCDSMALLANVRWPAVAGALAAGLSAVAFVDARRKSRTPHLQCSKDGLMARIVHQCPGLAAVYRACPFLTNGHVETIFAAVARADPSVHYYRRCLIMPDGAAIALDYELLPPELELPADAPVVLLLPGLTGGSHDVYVQHMVKQARQRGLRAVVFNGRGTSDSPVTTPQFYSASYTGDTRRVTNYLAEQFPSSPLMAVGWSLGANILLKYLGEEGAEAPFVAAASLCNPFDLPLANANFEQGFNRFYDYRLAQSLSNIYKRHMPLFLRRDIGFDTELAANCKTIRQFDDAITRVAFGWPSVDAYYEGSSSALAVPDITIPTLCIQAADDPIAPAEGIPYSALAANDKCILAVTPVGGHLGWVSPVDPVGAPSVHTTVVDFLSAALDAREPAAAKPPSEGRPIASMVH